MITSLSPIEIIYWAAAFLIVYPYVVYLVVLKTLTLVSRDRQTPVRSLKCPQVTLIISAYNEEASIEEKIRNSLMLDYPKELLEIIVVSDGSTDRTVEIASRFSDQGVKLRHYEGRIGKTACLNLIIPHAEGEIVVFSDANALYRPNAIKELIGPFETSRVGYVTGHTSYVQTNEKSAESAVESMSLYSRMQFTIKLLESRIGACIGADGAMFAIRKAHFEPLGLHDINDLVLPLRILLRGAEGKLAANAICAEHAFGTPQSQFRRQVRIAARSIRALLGHLALMNPFRFGLTAFKLVSNKALRMVCPFAMAALFLANIPLAFEHWFYGLTLILQCGVYGITLGTLHRPTGGPVTKFLSVANTFVVVNAAIGYGWIQYLRGVTFATWAPVRK